jgi:hypothetical protein
LAQRVDRSFSTSLAAFEKLRGLASRRSASAASAVASRSNSASLRLSSLLRTLGVPMPSRMVSARSATLRFSRSPHCLPSEPRGMDSSHRLVERRVLPVPVGGAGGRPGAAEELRLDRLEVLGEHLQHRPGLGDVVEHVLEAGADRGQGVLRLPGRHRLGLGGILVVAADQREQRRVEHHPHPDQTVEVVVGLLDLRPGLHRGVAGLRPDRGRPVGVEGDRPAELNRRSVAAGRALDRAVADHDVPQVGHRLLVGGQLGGVVAEVGERRRLCRRRRADAHLGLLVEPEPLQLALAVALVLVEVALGDVLDVQVEDWLEAAHLTALAHVPAGHREGPLPRAACWVATDSSPLPKVSQIAGRRACCVNPPLSSRMSIRVMRSSTGAEARSRASSAATRSGAPLSIASWSLAVPGLRCTVSGATVRCTACPWL